MQQSPFLSVSRSLVAGAASLAALFAVLFYLAAPSLAQPQVMASYARAAHTTVGGELRTTSGAPERHGKVRLVFRNAAGRVVKAETVQVDRHGRFEAPAPASAKRVTVTAAEGPGRKARRVSHTFVLRPGQELKVTAAFPKAGSGLLPGVFPY